MIKLGVGSGQGRGGEGGVRKVRVERGVVKVRVGRGVGGEGGVGKVRV